MSSRHRFLLAPLALGLALAAASSQAADKAAAKNVPSRGPGDRVLTPAQLKACVDQKADVQAKVDAAQTAKTALAADKTEIDRSGKALEEALATLDRTKAEEVSAHNAKVDERDQLIAGYQARVAAYNEQAGGVNAAQDEYAKACAERRYDERDLADIKRKKR